MGTHEQMDESVFFFPLRTNVEYFETAEGALSLESRVKEALILYDRVVFQSGLYLVDMGPGGAWDDHVAPTQMPRGEELRHFLDRRRKSEGFSFFIQPSPESPFQLEYSSETERSFHAQFHSLFGEVSSVCGNAVEMADLDLSDKGKQTAQARADAYFGLEDYPLPKASWMVQKKLFRNLFLDLLLVSALGWAGGMDSLHRPVLDAIIKQEAGYQAVPGFVALGIEVPHVAALPWEQIADVRKHPAIMEFREHLREAEETVRTMLPEAPPEVIQAEVAGVLHRELIREVRERMAPSGMELAGSVGLQIVGGVVPLVGTVQTGISVGKEVVDWHREQNSWLAVLMELSRVDR